ncbi:MAG: beta-propeller domain-containing protein [Oscillospiraceae bacterium]|nr:beta-propeller domain-containing protein [Oscillospiraceae bacterium]
MKRLLSVILSVILLGLAFAGCAGQNMPAPAQEIPAPNPQSPTGPAVPAASDPASAFESVGFLSVAESYDDVFTAVSENTARDGYGYGGLWRYVTDEAGAFAAVDDAVFSSVAPSLNAGAQPARAGEKYSSTNVQAEGYDEADRVKTDGEHIYVLNDNVLTVLLAAGEDTRVLSRITLFDSGEKNFKTDTFYTYTAEWCSDIYLLEDKLIALRSGTGHRGEKVGEDWVYTDDTYTYADVYDVSDPANPTLITSLGQEGDLMDSRLAGGVLYIVSSTYIYNNPSRDDPATYVPRTFAGGEEHFLPCGNILLCPSGSNSSYTVLTAIDLDTLTHTGSWGVYGSYVNCVYMNDSGIYLALETRRTTEETLPDQITRVDSTAVTALLRFLPDDIMTPAAGAEFEGTIIGQFALDEYRGALRVVATADKWHAEYGHDRGMDTAIMMDMAMAGDNDTCLLTFDITDMSLLGQITGIAPGERVYSVRFDGDVGYFVTFKNIDPLFAVDLSDPAKPVIMSQLKIPGFSTYLHPWDEGLLLGIGQSADEEGFTTGMKLSMFDVSDKFAVTETQALSLGQDSWSMALNDHHEVFVEPELGIFGFCLENPREDSRSFVIYTWQEGQFKQLASLDTGGDWSARGMYSGEYFYLLTGKDARVFSLSDFSPVSVAHYE